MSRQLCEFPLQLDCIYSLGWKMLNAGGETFHSGDVCFAGTSLGYRLVDVH